MSTWQMFGFVVVAQVTAITAAAAVGMACLRRRPAAAHSVGVVALAFLLASPALALLLPKSNWPGGSESADAPSLPRDTRTARVEAPETARPDEADSSTADSVTSPRSSALEESTAQHAVVEREQPAQAPAIVAVVGSKRLERSLDLAGIAWAVGVAVFAARFWVVWRQVRRLVSTLQPVAIPEQIAADVRAALAAAALPPVARSEWAPIPLVMGCRRPRVVLPQRLVETGTPAQLRDVLIHECAHVVRRDPWVNAAQQVAGVVFWPHPGVHWLNREIARAREEVCDNFVLRQGDSMEYAETLLELAERCGGAKFAISLLGLFSRRWTLESRIAGILSPNRERTTRAARSTPLALAALLAGICAFVGGLGGVGPAPGKVAAAADENRDTDAQSQKTTPAPAKDALPDPPQPPMKITIAGVCVDHFSTNIADVHVRVFRMSSYFTPPVLVAETHSDENGKFSFSDVEAVADPAQATQKTRLMVVGTAAGHASTIRSLNGTKDERDVPLVMANNPATLSGTVTDENDRPIQGVEVFMSPFSGEPLPGMTSAVTDELGHYAITDLRRWRPEDSARFDPKTGRGTMATACYFPLRHADYALTRAQYSSIPQDVNVTLHPLGTVEGQVLDQVTGKPLAGVTVSAQGITRHDWSQVRTDGDGRYRLHLNKDHYNIWAEAEDRIAVAVKAMQVEPGKANERADIRMLRGGYVVGSVLDGKTGKPIQPAANKPIHVAHYGPARPKTGAAVTSTVVNPDGSYRLRVAPGRNFVYLMSSDGASAYVEVVDGQETKLDLKTGVQVARKDGDDDPDQILGDKLRSAARQEDAKLMPKKELKSARVEVAPAKRRRADTPTGRLLDKLEEQNHGPELFHDSWLLTLKQICNLSYGAVPDLIDELDATEDDMMLRCLGFTTRAIGDKRAVSALIRAIPKTLLKPGSDMGLIAEDAELKEFAKQASLDPDRDPHYSFGRPVREIFAALHKLTGQTFNEGEIYHISLQGTASQNQMQRELYDRTAKQWAEWWDRHAAEQVDDPTYARVNLPDRAVAKRESALATIHYTTGSGSGNTVLESVLNPKSQTVFYDLDTGRQAALPQKWRDEKNIESKLDDIMVWAGHEGFDLMGTEYVAPDGRRYYAIRGIGLRAWELGPQYWKKPIGNTTAEALQHVGTPADGLLLHFDKETESIDPKATASYFYQTREGTPGLLYVGIEVQDDSLKPGGAGPRDHELDPVAFKKGRRFGLLELEEVK